MNIKKLLLITIGCILILTIANFSVIAFPETDMIYLEKDKFEPITMSDTLDQSQEVHDTDSAFGTLPSYNNIDVHAFQSFVPQLGKLTRIELLLAKDWEYPGTKNINLVIRENLNGENLTIASIAHTQIPPYGDFEWIEFDFPDIQVTIGKKYFIVCFVDWNPVGNCIYGWCVGDNNPYPEGKSGYSYDGGETWEYYSDFDHCFRTYGTVPDLEISGIKGGFGKVSADITNNLDHAIEGVDCTITINGGILNLINVESDITIDSLDSGESMTISTDGFIFGLGPVDIEVTADCDEVGEVTKTQNGFVLLFLVIFL